MTFTHGSEKISGVAVVNHSMKIRGGEDENYKHKLKDVQMGGILLNHLFFKSI